MPRILELKQIDNQLWVRLDLPLDESQPISLLTEEELRRVKTGAIGHFEQDIIAFMQNWKP